MPARVRRLILNPDHDILVSAASAWEISTKFRWGKLPGAADVAADVMGAVAGQGFEPLDITVRHAEHAGRLPGDRRDPFDRMLAAQAQIESLAIVSNDGVFDQYGVVRKW